MSHWAGSNWVMPDWPVPIGIRTAVSTRNHPGESLPPWDHFNLGDRCGDDPSHVAANRAALIDRLELPQAPHWLLQVHGNQVVRLSAHSAHEIFEADAAVTGDAGVVLAILTADCLPVLFASKDGERIGAAHAVRRVKSPLGWDRQLARTRTKSAPKCVTPLSLMTAAPKWLSPKAEPVIGFAICMHWQRSVFKPAVFGKSTAADSIPAATSASIHIVAIRVRAALPA